MKRLNGLGVASVAVVILGMVVGVSSALATAPEFVLQEGSFPVAFTGSSGTGGLETAGKTAVKCTVGKTKGQLTTSKEGSLDMVFEECSSGLVKCKSAGSAAGVVLTEGSFTVVLDYLSPVNAGLLVKPKEYTIECEGVTSAKVKGSFLVPLQYVDILATLLEPLLDETTGKPLFTRYWDSTGKENTALLQASINGGAFEEAAYSATAPQLTFAKEIELRTGELIETPIVATSKVGGTAGGGATKCEFTATGQMCEVKVENVSTGTIEIGGQEIFETISNVHYYGSYVKFESRTNECKAPGWFKNGTSIAPTGSCLVNLKMTGSIPTLPSELKGGYYVKVNIGTSRNVAGSVMLTEAKQ